MKSQVQLDRLAILQLPDQLTVGNFKARSNPSRWRWSLLDLSIIGRKKLETQHPQAATGALAAHPIHDQPGQFVLLATFDGLQQGNQSPRDSS